LILNGLELFVIPSDAVIYQADNNLCTSLYVIMHCAWCWQLMLFILILIQIKMSQILITMKEMASTLG